MSTSLSARISATLEAKGWALYAAPTASGENRDVASLVTPGRATQLQPNTPYCILPLTQRDNDPHEVGRHLEYAKRSRQLPTYHDGERSSSQVVWIVLRPEGLELELLGRANTYRFSLDDALSVIRHRLSNYNIHYFESISALRDFIEPRCTEQQMDALKNENPRWKLVHPQGDSTRAALYPAGPSRFLFRGQTERHRPCLPTATRGLGRDLAIRDLDDPDQATLVLNLVRTAWFNQNLRDTPPMKWMSQQRLTFDETAVAQHYRLPTGYIDLSESFDVATFFSCCRFVREEAPYEPVGDGEGVLYVVDREIDAAANAVKPIFLQPFPRPSEQWGWVHEMRLGTDFECLHYVRKMVFKHRLDMSADVFRRFHGGRSLFPRDPLALLAEKIRTCRVLPAVMADSVAADIIADPLGLPEMRKEDVLDLVEKEKDVRFSKSLSPLDALDSTLRTELRRNWCRARPDFPPPVTFDLVSCHSSKVG